MRTTLSLCASLIAIGTIGSGCTALVESTLAGRGGDAGMGAIDVGPGHDSGPTPDVGPMPDSGPASPCAGMPNGLHCTMTGIDEPFVCVDGSCQLSRCGDGAQDPRVGSMHTAEDCDDGNSIPGDGCEMNCTYSCHAATDCDDGLSCNGDETCDTATTHICLAGTNATDLTPCVVGGIPATCHSGVCRSGVCGDGNLDMGEECDDHNLNDGDGCDADCTFTCADDSTCQNGNACDGNETCNAASHVCVAATMALDCDDMDACTTDSCDMAMGCVNASVLMDNDGDGFTANVTGCGGDNDCDDSNPMAYPGAPEMCTDTSDLNCDGMHGMPPIYYSDCDHDGYATASAATMQSCTPPSSPPSCASGLTGQWITVAPTAGHTDCLENTTMSAQAHPLQSSYFPTNLSGLSPTFDYDCSGSQSVEFSHAASGSVPRGLTTACTYETFGHLTICTGDSWYVTSTLPACGSSVTLSHCHISTFPSGCLRTTTAGALVACH